MINNVKDVIGIVYIYVGVLVFVCGFFILFLFELLDLFWLVVVLLDFLLLFEVEFLLFLFGVLVFVILVGLLNLYVML